MTFFANTAAALAVLAFGAATPAVAKTISTSTVAAASPVGKACVLNLKSAQCGRYQTRVLLVAAQRQGTAIDTAAMREIGRDQVDALVDSIG